MTSTLHELNHPEAQRLLRDAPLLRLAYDGVDGTPRVIPIGFFWNGEQVVICTATIAPKVRALALRPAVAITIDEGATSTDAKSLLIRGKAAIDVVEGIPEEYIAGARKTLPPDQVAGFEDAVGHMYEQMARITIAPAWARFYDFGAGRLPGFLDRMVREAEVR